MSSFHSSLFSLFTLFSSSSSSFISLFLIYFSLTHPFSSFSLFLILLDSALLNFYSALLCSNCTRLCSNCTILYCTVLHCKPYCRLPKETPPPPWPPPKKNFTNHKTSFYGLKSLGVRKKIVNKFDLISSKSIYQKPKLFFGWGGVGELG